MKKDMPSRLSCRKRTTTRSRQYPLLAVLLSTAILLWSSDASDSDQPVKTKELDRALLLLEESKFDLSSCIEDILEIGRKFDAEERPGGILAAMAFVMQRKDPVGLADPIIGLLDASVRMMPEDARLKIELLAAHLRRALKEDVQEVERMAHEMLATSSEMDPGMRSVVHMLLGDALLLKGKAREAFSCLSRAIDDAGSESKVACTATFKLLQLAKIQNATLQDMDHLSVALGENGIWRSIPTVCLRHTPTTILLSRTLAEIGMTSESLQILQRAIALNPGRLDLKARQASLLKKLHRFGESRSIAEAAIKRIESVLNDRKGVDPKTVEKLKAIRRDFEKFATD